MECVTVGGVAAHVSPLELGNESYDDDDDNDDDDDGVTTDLTMCGAPGAVTGALDARPDKGEAVGVHKGVDRLEAGVGHLHVA